MRLLSPNPKPKCEKEALPKYHMIKRRGQGIFLYACENPSVQCHIAVLYIEAICGTLIQTLLCMYVFISVDSVMQIPPAPFTFRMLILNFCSL